MNAGTSSLLADYPHDSFHTCGLGKYKEDGRDMLIVADSSHDGLPYIRVAKYDIADNRWIDGYVVP